MRTSVCSVNEKRTRFKHREMRWSSGGEKPAPFEESGVAAGFESWSAFDRAKVVEMAHRWQARTVVFRLRRPSATVSRILQVSHRPVSGHEPVPSEAHCLMLSIQEALIKASPRAFLSGSGTRMTNSAVSRFGRSLEVAKRILAHSQILRSQAARFKRFSSDRTRQGDSIALRCSSEFVQISR